MRATTGLTARSCYESSIHIHLQEKSLYFRHIRLYKPEQQQKVTHEREDEMTKEAIKKIIELIEAMMKTGMTGHLEIAIIFKQGEIQRVDITKKTTLKI